MGRYWCMCKVRHEQDLPCTASTLAFHIIPALCLLLGGLQEKLEAGGIWHARWDSLSISLHPGNAGKCIMYVCSDRDANSFANIYENAPWH